MSRMVFPALAAGAFGAFFACASTSPLSPSTDAADPGDVVQPDAADVPDVIDVIDGAGGGLDAGGPLVAPFTCPTDGIQGEPRPAAQVLELLRVAATLDSLGQRLANDGDAGTDSGMDSGRPTWLVTAGVPCSSATDVDACRLALAQLSSNGEALYPAFDEGDYFSPAHLGKPPGYYLAHTKGDAVGKLSNLQELRALYPSVDAPAKAVVFAHAAGYRVECHLAGWLREEPDGYVLVASRGHERRCSRVDVILFVRRDGSTVERAASGLRPDPCT